MEHWATLKFCLGYHFLRSSRATIIDIARRFCNTCYIASSLAEQTPYH